MQNTNKIVLITGCANGIGNHLAHCFYKNNYSVIATDIDFEALKTAFNTPNTEGVLTEKLDVTDAENWQLIIEKVKNKFGRLDICINNAGVIIPAFVSEMEAQTIDLQLNVNIKGVIYGTKYAADLMAEQGFGHIINFSSLAGVAPIHGLAIYSATKHAVRAFTLSVVPELRAKGIHLSVICPDLVNTNMLTLQLDYKAAALTFSGDKYLTVNDIEKAIFNRALQNKEVEIMIPKMRGITAKIGNLFPSIGFYLTRVLEKKGLKKQAAYAK
jgi:3-oxoacyl-[acyl-carrier protein] reductase